MHYERWATPYWKAGLPLPPKPKAVKEPKVCSIEDCGKKALGRGWCSMHYYRWQKYGDPLVVKQRATCAVDDCERPAAGRGLCLMHYRRERKHGDPLAVTVILGDDRARFESHVDRSGGPDACHPWTGWVEKRSPNNKGGYGRFRLNGKTPAAHVVAWEFEHGPKPPNVDIDHECHNRAVREGTCQPGICAHRACCNPAHLVARSPQEHRDSTKQWDMPRGSANSQAKLTEEHVHEIRKLLDSGALHETRIAELYGVSRRTIADIRKRRSWGWLVS